MSAESEVLMLKQRRALQEEHKPGGSVELERREDRYIIYVRDTPELVEALARYTRELSFPDTPITRTIYLGDITRGLPSGLSIKVRSYERERLSGRWDLTPESEFALLEIKRTVKGVKARPVTGPAEGKPSTVRRTGDRMVEILRLSGSILGRTTYKSKRRRPRISLAETWHLLRDPSAAREAIDRDLYLHLLETVGALADFGWFPIIGTEYERTHFVTHDERYRDLFRATLDKRVTHYAFDANEGNYVGVPVGTEDFCRFEVKRDDERLAGTPLSDWLDEIIVSFRALRIPSKKYRGMTLRSAYQIQREGFRNESPGSRMFTEFPGRPVRDTDHQHLANLAGYIKSSKTFRPYWDVPMLLEQHWHYVGGSYKGLAVSISGSQLNYVRDRERIAVKPIAIFREDARPVTTVPLVSRDDLNNSAALPRMKHGKSYFIRSRGFLVENRKSGRIYKVALERRISGGAARAKYFVVVEYVGRAKGRPRFQQTPIIKDLQLLFRFLDRNRLLKRA